MLLLEGPTMKQILSVAMLLALVAAPLVAQAATLDDASEALGKINDYTASLVVHEILGTSTQDRTYGYRFKKPHFISVDVVVGPDAGAAIVYKGGTQVRAHKGGMLAMIKMNMDLHDKRVLSLRGDSIDTGTFGSVLDELKSTKGTMSEADGASVDGIPTTAVTLVVADPAANHNVSKEVVFFAKSSHLPVRRERYEGERLVKDEKWTSVKLNVGLTDANF